MINYCVDANVFITAWYAHGHDGYPPDIFASLWEQLADKKDEIILIKPIFDEIEPISPSDNKLDAAKKKEKYPVRMWLIENGFTETPINDDVNMASLELEREYEVSDISKGAGPKDMLLIAFAKMNENIVVTFEAVQKQRPRSKSKYKIPLICTEKNVKCITFIDMLQKLKIRV